MELSGKNNVSFSNYLERTQVILLSILFVAFPLVFTTATTDPYILPKEILISLVVVVSLALWGLKMVVEGTVSIRRSPFDVPLLIFVFVAILSAVVSLNRADALINLAPVIVLVLLFFVITNTIRTKDSLFILLVSFLVGTAGVSVLGILAYFKVYLPVSLAQAQLFTPLGSVFDLALYLGVAILIGTHAAWKEGIIYLNSDDHTPKGTVLAILSFLALLGAGFTLYELVYLQPPILLPFIIGFQTGFASISQDAARVVQSFLFGNGYGTYVNVFTRFKPAAFNQNPLWSFTFFRSSSYVLELLATVGFLGLISFLFFIFKLGKELKATRNVFTIPLALLGVSLFLLPFSFVALCAFFIVLALFASHQHVHGVSPKKFYDMKLFVVAFEQGIIAFSHVGGQEEAHPKINKENSRILPFVLLLVLILLFGGFTYLLGKYVYSDYLFQKSLIAASLNKGSETYDLENQAIQLFPYRDGYYRIFSQTNLALANLLAQQQNGKKPNQQTQQTIYTLIQQSINSARTASQISPASSLNWQNLASIYRSLIGFGQNAEQFSILASQQAILLDPNSPQEYINLGGIYYQLSQWDEAQRQFQTAVSLKPDYPNGYYNLGHVLEQKGDLQGALNNYKTVKNLVVNDPVNYKKIQSEIAVLEDKIKAGATTSGTPTTTQKTGESSLGINQPETTLPEQKPPVKIPAPVISTPAPTK